MIKNERTRRITAVIAIILMLTTLGGFFYWVKYGQEQFVYKRVITTNAEITKGTVITKDMLKVSKFDEGNIINGSLVDASSIIGMASKQYIPRNSQITLDFFDNPDIVVDENQYVFQIPDEWIYAFPSSLRRKDEIYFYAIELNNISGMNQTIQPDNSNDTEATVSEPHILSTEQSNKLSEKLNNDESFIKASVAYVKDSANREVVDSGSNERYDGSSQISNIEIIATLDQVNTLERYIDNGYKFIILYK